MTDPRKDHDSDPAIIALSVIAYERKRKPRVIEGECVDVKKDATPPPIINMADDRPIWLQRDRSKE